MIYVALIVFALVLVNFVRFVRWNHKRRDVGQPYIQWLWPVLIVALLAPFAQAVSPEQCCYSRQVVGSRVFKFDDVRDTFLELDSPVPNDEGHIAFDLGGKSQQAGMWWFMESPDGSFPAVALGKPTKFIHVALHDGEKNAPRLKGQNILVFCAEHSPAIDGLRSAAPTRDPSVSAPRPVLFPRLHSVLKRTAATDTPPLPGGVTLMCPYCNRLSTYTQVMPTPNGKPGNGRFAAKCQNCDKVFVGGPQCPCGCNGKCGGKCNHPNCTCKSPAEKPPAAPVEVGAGK